ncbi:MAG: MurR/RpiR family transcriptional regulator [Actinomycetes bacterium]
MAPTPVLEALRDAAEHCGAVGKRLFTTIADDYPSSLERRPAQLLQDAGAASEDLERLLGAAGFVDTDDLRERAAKEAGRRLVEPDLRFTYREGAAGDRAELRPLLRREYENLAETLQALQANGALEMAAKAILAGRRRWVLGELKSTGYAGLFASDLTTALRDVTLIQPTAAGCLTAISDAHRKDTLVVFSLRSYGRLTVSVAEQFHAIGATVIAVTDNYDSPVCAYADHVLRVMTRSESVAHSPTAVAAVGHILAALSAAGAKGATRRSHQRYELSRALQCYWEDGLNTAARETTEEQS